MKTVELAERSIEKCTTNKKKQRKPNQVKTCSHLTQMRLLKTEVKIMHTRASIRRFAFSPAITICSVPCTQCAAIDIGRWAVLQCKLEIGRRLKIGHYIDLL